MEQPFVGRKADVMNKRGTVALFNKKEEEALEFWAQAKLLQENHFDSTCNFIMYRWSSGRITDAEMMTELEDQAFGHGPKGQLLRAFLNLAIGNLQIGKSQI